MEDVYERQSGRVSIAQAECDGDAFLPFHPPAPHRLYLAARRVGEMLFAVLGCIAVLLMTPLAWLINAITAPGDVFYRQDRVGKDEKIFRIVKFRTMVMGAEELTGPVWAGPADRRVTPLGRALRKTRLDELPQCWNIITGDMGLIGPRPERPEFVAELEKAIPRYRLRHIVRPGLTGWAQVQHDYGASVEEATVKTQYDLYYIEHQGLWLDLLVLLRTVPVVLRASGR